MDLFDIAIAVVTTLILIWGFVGITRDARRARRDKKWREID